MLVYFLFATSILRTTVLYFRLAFLNAFRCRYAWPRPLHSLRSWRDTRAGERSIAGEAREEFASGEAASEIPDSSPILPRLCHFRSRLRAQPKQKQSRAKSRQPRRLAPTKQHCLYQSPTGRRTH